MIARLYLRGRFIGSAEIDPARVDEKGDSLRPKFDDELSVLFVDEDAYGREIVAVGHSRLRDA